ncbi:Fic family protein [Patescibacteria group bacterium]
MNFEDNIKQQKEEERERVVGSEKLEKFLEKIIDVKDLENPDFFMDILGQVDYSQFMAHLERINGIIKQIPIANRDSFDSESKIVSSFMMTEGSAEIVPPRKEMRVIIMEEAFNRAKEISLGDDENKKKIVSRLIFNAIIYLHPFKDGNGRTARALYKLLSLEGKDEEWNLSKIIKVRSEKLKDYHEGLNFFIFDQMLSERNVKWLNSESEENSVWPHYIDETIGIGFDKTYLGFLSAYQAMSEEEINKYVSIGERDKNFINGESLPQELKSRIQSEKIKLREEFVRKILDASSNDQEWPEELSNRLKDAFE